MKIIRTYWPIPVLAILFLILAGCMSTEEVTAYKIEAEANKDLLDQRITFLEEAKTEATVVGDIELVQKYDGKIKVAEALKGGVVQAVIALDKIFTEQGQFRQPEEIVQALDPILPVGVGSIGLLVIGLLRSLSKQSEWKKNFKDLVGGIEDTKEDDPAFARALTKAGPVLRSRLPSNTLAKIKTVKNGS